MADKRFFGIVLSICVFISSAFPGTAGVQAEDETVYPAVSAADMTVLLTQATDAGHPRLMADEADFERVREQISDEESPLAGCYVQIKAEASDYLSFAPKSITVDIDKESYFSRGSEAIRIVMVSAFVYLIEKDEAYAQRAYDEALYFADMTSWGKYQFIDSNQAAFAVALCYDWLYEWLGEQEGRREALSDSIWNNLLTEVYDLFENPSASRYSTTYYRWYFDSNNHTALNNCYTFLSALAVCEADSEKSALIMSGALTNLEKVFDRMYPDGGWYEGVSYWNNVGLPLARMFSSMEAAFDTTFGYENIPHITDTAYFPVYLQTGNGTVVYSDAVSSVYACPEMYYLGKMGANYDVCNYVMDCGNYSPLLCLWYDEETTGTDCGLKEDRFFEGVSFASMRSTWSGNQPTFAAMAVQNANVTHGYMNSGTFFIDALGERWVSNPERDEYTLDGYWDYTQNGKRWQYYCTRAEAGSCIVINPSADGGQTVDSDDTIDVFESGKNNSFCISDLTDSYPDALSYKRGLMLYDSKSRVLLRDELVFDEPGDICSFINVYKAETELTPVGAILKKGNKKMFVKISSDKPYKLSKLSASPLPTSPDPEGQKDYTADFERLCIEFENVSEVNISVEFIPFFADDIPAYNDVEMPLESWAADDGASAKPKLEGISINGVLIENFDENNLYYKVYPESIDADISAHTSEANIVTVKKDERNCCCTITVTSSDGTASETYLLDIGLKGEVIADAHVGGSLSESEFMLDKNYGASDKVVIRDNGKYSVIAYYTLKLPEIPSGMKIKKLTLAVNQFRKTGTDRAEQFEFYPVNPGSWNESEITYNSAPVKHSYSDSWYPYKDTASQTEVSAEMSLKVSDIFTVGRSLAFSDAYYRPVEYDITPLSDEPGGEISFVIGVPDSDKRSLSTIYTASKENADKSLVPKVQVEIENTDGENKITAADTDADVYGDSVLSHAYIINQTASDKALKLYTAAYSKDGRMINVTVSDISLSSDSAALFYGEKLKCDEDTASVRVFVWDENLFPFKMKEKEVVAGE